MDRNPQSQDGRQPDLGRGQGAFPTGAAAFSSPCLENLQNTRTVLIRTVGTGPHQADPPKGPQPDQKLCGSESQNQRAAVLFVSVQNRDRNGSTWSLVVMETGHPAKGNELMEGHQTVAQRLFPW